MTLFWGMLLGATLPALIVWVFGRHLRRISGQPGLADYMRMRQRRARRGETSDLVLNLLLDERGNPLSEDKRRKLERHLGPGPSYRSGR